MRNGPLLSHISSILKSAFQSILSPLDCCKNFISSPVTGLARGAGSVTGTNFLGCSYGKFHLSRPGCNSKTKLKWWNIKLYDCRSFEDSCNFTNKVNSNTS